MSIQPTHNESGSVLWFILVAIALLVALTVTVTRTTETSEDTGTRDRNRIMASDILRQARAVEQAVEALTLKGFGENNISFQNNVFAGYTNPRCTSEECRIFDTPRGAGLTYKTPLPDWLDSQFSALSEPEYGQWYFMGRACIRDVGTGGAGCGANDSEAELLMVLPWVRRDLCLEINRLLGIENPGTPPSPPRLTADAFPATYDLFTGTFEASAEIAHPSLNAKKTACFEADTTHPAGGFHFYHVLIAR
jgi:hypothetical protein